MKRIATLCLLIGLLCGCAQPTAYSTVTADAWSGLIQQVPGGQADDVLAQFAALPQPSSPTETAQLWALAVQARNGYAQFALLDESLQAQTRLQYEASGWQTGVPTPWVENFDIAGKAKKPEVCFRVVSGGAVYTSIIARLNCKSAGGVYRIHSITVLQGEGAPSFYH